MTTQNVVGVYRGMAHWHLVVNDHRGVGWDLEFEPELKPPRGSDFTLDFSPPPPFGPSEFAIEVTFKRRITSRWPAVGWFFAVLLGAATGCVIASLWLPDGYAKRLFATFGLGMSLMGCIVGIRSLRQNLRTLKASEARLREAQARLEALLGPPEES